MIALIINPDLLWQDDGQMLDSAMGGGGQQRGEMWHVAVSDYFLSLQKEWIRATGRLLSSPEPTSCFTLQKDINAL